MKPFFNLSGFMYFILISIIFLPCSLGFSLSFPRTQGNPLPETHAASHEGDVLSEALSRAFPPSFGHNPAYVAALAVFRDLESKTSCHRAAAASLVSDCTAIQDKNDVLKVTFAARLAVCELEATGIKFPRECQSTDGSPLRQNTVLECVEKLEKRPQWWTTLSNNIQSAVVMCTAVRHEVEKDEILSLHKNITKTQKSLFSALSTSLEGAWESIKAQESFRVLWKTALNDVLEDLAETRENVVDVLKDAEANAMGIIKKLVEEIEISREKQRQTTYELDQLALRAKDGFEGLEKHSQKMSKMAETAIIDLSADFNAQRVAIEQNMQLIHQTSSRFYIEFNSSTVNMLHIFESLTTKINDTNAKFESLANAFKPYSSLFDSISNSYNDLENIHSALTESFSKQEELQQQSFLSIERANHRANVTFEDIWKALNNLTQRLDETNAAAHSRRVNGSDWAGIPISSIMFISGIIFGRGWEKVILVSLGALVVISMILIIGFTRLSGGGFLGMFSHEVFKKPPFEVEPFTGESLNNTGRVISSHWFLFSCLIAMTMAMCGILFFLIFRYRSRTLVEDFDKL